MSNRAIRFVASTAIPNSVGRSDIDAKSRDKGAAVSDRSVNAAKFYAVTKYEEVRESARSE